MCVRRIIMLLFTAAMALGCAAGGAEKLDQATWTRLVVGVVYDLSASAVEQRPDQLARMNEVARALAPGDRLLLVRITERSYRAGSVSDFTLPAGDTLASNRFDPSAVAAAAKNRLVLDSTRARIARSIADLDSLPPSQKTDLYGGVMLAAEGLAAVSSGAGLQPAMSSVRRVLLILGDLGHDASPLPARPIAFDEPVAVRVIYSPSDNETSYSSIAESKTVWRHLLCQADHVLFHPPGISLALDDLRSLPVQVPAPPVDKCVEAAKPVARNPPDAPVRPGKERRR